MPPVIGNNIKNKILIDNISFIDKSFDLKNISNYHLSLQVYLKGFSFCILDRERNKYIAFGNNQYSKITSFKILASEIERLLNENKWLKLPYQHVKLIFATPRYTFIPSPLYNPLEERRLFDFNNKLGVHEELNHNFIYGNSSYVVYSIPDSIKSVFEQYYPSVRVYHQSCPMIEEILLKNKLTNTNIQAYLNIYPDFIDFAILDKTTLKLFNTFTIQSTTDFQYFILNSFDQLQLSSLNVPLSISGLIKKDDAKIDILKKFIKQIDYLNKPSHFEYSYGFQDIPDHYFTNMINLYQCG